MPAVIDADTVRHVARLARLGLDAGEQERMQRELSGILEHIETIQSLDLDDVPPTSHVVHIENVVREDEVRPCLDRDLALREAPATREGGFLVPRMD
jgi:aspartyl-tRNA(Asn)/glutamyl-tRNA(Gln) amidotransferase subunit C